jgi:2,3-diketo-5-methylthio-1-phosphopentane phosphatase
MPGPAALSHDQAGCVEPARLAVRVGEANAAGAGRVLESGFGAGTQRLGPLELRVDLADEGGVVLAMPRVRNASAQAVRLDAVVLGFRWKRPGLACVQFLRHGWQSRSYSGSRPLEPRGGGPERAAAPRCAVRHTPAELPPDRSGWHESALVSVVGAARGGAVCLAGVYERGRAFGVLYLRPERDAVRIEVELRLEAVVEPGDAPELEPVHLALGCDAAALLEAFAEAYGRRAHARAFRPFLASWSAGRSAPRGPSEEQVRRDLAVLAALRDRIAIDVLQIEDGWQRATGDWLETHERFPRGLAPLAGEIREAGFIPGLWTAPFCVAAGSELFGKHREWLLRDGPEPLRVPVDAARAPQGPLYALDTGRREVAAHVEGVFRDLVDMGFLVLTLDLLHAAALHAPSSASRWGRAQRLRRGLDAVRAGAGDEVFLLGCDCPMGAAVGVVDAMRVAPDPAPADCRESADDVSGGDPRGTTRNILARAWMHRRLWLNDPGCLPLDAEPALGSEDLSKLASVVAGTGSLVGLTGDAQRLTGAAGTLARAAIASARAIDASGIPGAARVLDPLAAELPECVAALDPAGGYLALLNDGDTAVQRALGRAMSGAGGRRIAAVEECIGSAPALAERADVRALDPHAGALLRVRCDTSLAVFCDFDGTFSVLDVGAALAERHVGSRRPEVWARFERGEIRAWDYNMEVLDGLEVPLPMLEDFLHSLRLDPGAADLVAWCAARDVPFRIASDGFDWNLNRLQQIHRVRFAYAANHLHYERGRWRIRPGRPDPTCECGTGSCKGSILRSFRAEHPRATLVHIGNGRVSDTCGALAADLAFAKDSLALELARRGARFEPFATLRDVIPGLERALAAVSG